MAAAGQIFVQVGRALVFFKTRDAAVQAARQTLLNLTVRDFCETLQLTWDRADVYGVRLEGAGWYVKLTIDESIPEGAVISFHPLERPLKTNAGTVKP